jgi:Micrococcal nuclease (thermonuclease) homologs
MPKKLGAAILTAVTITTTGLAVGYKHFIDPYEKVYKIADGDTFILENNKQAVRLFGIDAPEVTNCYGKESYQRLDQLLKKRKVQLKEPVVDKFGRIVSLVYVDGKLINEVLIKEGFAAYRSEPGSEKEVMKKAHEDAKTNQRGIYSSACTDLVPPDPKCTIKGNHDLDRNEFLYLTTDCPYYSAVIVRRFEGDQWFCTEKDAIKAGFKKSTACDLGVSRNNKRPI